MVEIAYEQGKLAGDLHLVGSLALQTYLFNKRRNEYEKTADFSEGLEQRFMAFLRPELFDALQEQERQEELNLSISEDDFMAEIRRLKSG